MKYKQLTNYLLKVILALIALLPLIYYNQIEAVPIKAFILGTGSWGIGLIFKMLSHQLIVVPLQYKKQPILFISIINGFLSGFFELFAAYLIIIFMKDKFLFDYNAIICFGLAIGSLETIIVATSKNNDLLKGTSLEKQSEKLDAYLNNLQGLKYFIFNLIFPVIERILATFLHISTRGLVFLTIITGSIIPILIALVVFVIADGLLGYYYYLSGKLTSSRGLVNLFIYLTILSIMSTAIFIFLINPHKDILL